MPTTPIFMLKPLGKEDIAINRTIKVIGDGDGPFDVLVTDRDYVDDPSGQSQTIVFKESFLSMDDAAVELKRQVDLSRAEGFIDNKLSMI